MGAFSGSITIRRYRVLGTPPRDFADRFTRGVRSHALVPLNPKKNPQEDRAVGWCSIHDNEDLDLSFEKLWVEGRVVLGLRVDTLKPPAAEVKRQLRIRAREEEARIGVPLSRTALRELKEQIAAELRVRTPPKTKVVDMIWKVDDKKVYFFSHSKSVNEFFIDLFAQTFGLPIDIEGPGAWAQTLSAAAGSSDDLTASSPTPELLTGFPYVRPGTADDSTAMH